MSRFSLAATLVLLALPILAPAHGTGHWPAQPYGMSTAHRSPAPESRHRLTVREAEPESDRHFHYVGANYFIGEGSAAGSEDDMNGPGVAASYLAQPKVYLAARFRNLETDETDVDLDQTGIVIGTKTNLGPDVDAFGEVGFSRIGGDDDGDDLQGVELGLGFIGHVSERTSILGQYSLLSLDDADANQYQFDIAFDVNHWLTATLGYRVFEIDFDNAPELDIDSVQIGLRYRLPEPGRAF